MFSGPKISNRRIIMVDGNIQLVHRTIEDVWNGRNPSAVEELVSSDWLGHSSLGPTSGPAEYRQYFDSLRAAFSDLRFDIEDQIAQGDKVAVRWTARATHDGNFMGLPPTGVEGEVRGISIYRVAGNKLVEGWTQLDELGLMRQLGALRSAPSIG
jgi:steroid delta-isomerase-like uncharacterized protein